MPDQTVIRTVAAGEEPGRLDAYLARALDGVTRGEAQRWIREGRVSVNGAPARRPSKIITPGDRVAVEPPPPTAAAPVARKIEFGVAYLDSDLVVVDKPAGLTVHPGAGHKDDTLVNGILDRWPEIASVGDPERPGIVHRLDRETSGLLAVARSATAYDGLVSAIKARRVVRRYEALVWGRVSPDEGIIDAPVGRDPRHRQRQAVESGGRPARTRYRVSRHLPSTTLLEVSLETGRMHQIRVHLAAISFPVVGDQTYGRSGFGLNRQFLHASYMALDHPVTGERIEVEAPLPADLAAALELAESAGRSR